MAWVVGYVVAVAVMIVAGVWKIVRVGESLLSVCDCASTDDCACGGAWNKRHRS